MPYRTLNLVLGLLGLLAIAGLLLARVDLARVARRGPRWRRRLLAAGLSLLSALGLTPPAQAAPATTAAARGPTLATAPEWKRVQQIWTEADEIASGKRGPYPFDAAGKKRVLDALAAARKDIESLVKAKVLSPPEGTLLSKELDRMIAGVQEKRVKAAVHASCYEPMPYRVGRDALQRLADRAPLLAKLAAGRRVDPAVLQKIARTIEADLSVVEGARATDLSDSDRRRARQIGAAIRSHLARIRDPQGTAKKPPAKKPPAKKAPPKHDPLRICLSMDFDASSRAVPDPEPSASSRGEVIDRLHASGTITPEAAERLHRLDDGSRRSS
jgi:hypothetical protein